DGNSMVGELRDQRIVLALLRRCNHDLVDARCRRDGDSRPEDERPSSDRLEHLARQARGPHASLDHRDGRHEPEIQGTLSNSKVKGARLSVPESPWVTVRLRIDGPKANRPEPSAAAGTAISSPSGEVAGTSR